MASSKLWYVIGMVCWHSILADWRVLYILPEEGGAGSIRGCSLCVSTDLAAGQAVAKIICLSGMSLFFMHTFVVSHT